MPCFFQSTFVKYQFGFIKRSNKNKGLLIMLKKCKHTGDKGKMVDHK